MSLRGRALHALLARIGRGWQSVALPTTPGDVVIVGADQAILGDWPEWLPDVAVRCLGERVLLTRELPPLLAGVVDPRAVVLMTGTSNLFGVGDRGHAARAVDELRLLLHRAFEVAPRAQVIVVGVPPRVGQHQIVEYNTTAAALVRGLGASFIDAPAQVEPSGLGYVLSATTWNTATYASIASGIAEALGTKASVPARPLPDVALEGGLTDRARLLRQDLFRALPAPTGRVVLLGDSITEGGAWDGWLRAFAPINRGISGNRISHVVERLDTALHAPAAVSLLIGTNDLATGTEPRDPDSIAVRFRHLVSKISESAPTTPLLINSVMPRSTRYAQSITRLNRHYRRTADEFGATFLDLWPLMATPGGRLRPELTIEGLHLNATGYRVWSDALTPALSSLVG